MNIATDVQRKIKSSELIGLYYQKVIGKSSAIATVPKVYLKLKYLKEMV